MQNKGSEIHIVSFIASLIAPGSLMFSLLSSIVTTSNFQSVIKISESWGVRVLISQFLRVLGFWG